MAKRPDGRVNIPRDVEDIYYRYHMPVLRARIEGRGNGVKTVIENMSDIAAALERPPTYTTKYFGFELGAQVMCDEKHDKYVVNGRHDQDALAKILDVFIEKFLLCGTCRNPETNMEIMKNGNIQMRCMACGETTPIDMRHRLAAFILKNPPSSTKYEKVAAKVEERQAKKTGNVGAAKDSEKDEGMGSADIDASGTKATAEDEAFGDDWNDTDFSKTAVEKRRMELLGAKGSEVTNEDPVDSLATYFNQTPMPPTKDILSHVKTVALAHGWKEAQVLGAVFGALFAKDILKVLKARTPILALYVQSQSDQKHVLYLVERLCSKDSNAALKVSSILNGFYEADLLEEEALVKWFKHPTKKIDAELGKTLRERSAKFIEWLTTAEDEEEDEEEEEDDE